MGHWGEGYPTNVAIFMTDVFQKNEINLPRKFANDWLHYVSHSSITQQISEIPFYIANPHWF